MCDLCDTSCAFLQLVRFHTSGLSHNYHTSLFQSKIYLDQSCKTVELSFDKAIFCFENMGSFVQALKMHKKCLFFLPL